MKRDFKLVYSFKKIWKNFWINFEQSLREISRGISAGALVSISQKISVEFLKLLFEVSQTKFLEEEYLRRGLCYQPLCARKTKLSFVKKSHPPHPLLTCCPQYCTHATRRTACTAETGHKSVSIRRTKPAILCSRPAMHRPSEKDRFPLKSVVSTPGDSNRTATNR